MKEIRWCRRLHVEQLNSPYVYINKSKTNGSLSRDTGKRRDVAMRTSKQKQEQAEIQNSFRGEEIEIYEKRLPTGGAEKRPA